MGKLYIPEGFEKRGLFKFIVLTIRLNGILVKLLDFLIISEFFLTLFLI